MNSYEIVGLAYNAYKNRLALSVCKEIRCYIGCV